MLVLYVFLAVVGLPRLESLNMNGNHFGDDGCSMIEEEFELCSFDHKLLPLDEDNGVISDEEEDDLQNGNDFVTFDQFIARKNIKALMDLGSCK